MFYVHLRKTMWTCFAFLLRLHSYSSNPALITLIKNNIQNDTTEQTQTQEEATPTSSTALPR